MLPHKNTSFRANIMSFFALILALAAFVNSWLANGPIALGAPKQESVVEQHSQTNSPSVDISDSEQKAISLQANTFTVPPYIGYQGVLRDGEGKPINGQKNVTFRIYDDITKPVDQSLWQEEQNNITIRDGRFSVLLGNSNPISPTLIASPDRFVGVQVEGYQEMQPRQRFSSVPYAMYSNMASNLGNPDGNPINSISVRKGLYFQNSGVNPGDSLPNARLEESWGMRFNSPVSRWVFSSKPSVLIGYEPNGQSWGDGNLLVQGNVGIGTAAPTHKFHVVADSAVGLFESTSNQAYLRLSTSEGFNNRVEVTNRPGGRFSVWTSGAGDAFNVTRGGQVGIGTQNPVATLDINGDVVIGGQKPIFFQRFTDLGNPVDHPTGIPSSQYMCGIAGWAVLHGDIQENNAGNYIAETFRSDDGTWHIKADFHWQGVNGSWYITLICVDNRLAEDRGGIP